MYFFMSLSSVTLYIKIIFSMTSIGPPRMTWRQRLQRWLDQALIASPYVVMALGVGGALIMGYWTLGWQVGLFVFGAGLLLNLALKAVLYWLGPKARWQQRPSSCPGAAGPTQCEQCTGWYSLGAPLTGWRLAGMPSGHAQFVALVATLCTAWLWTGARTWPWSGRLAALGVVWAWALLVMAQRYWSGCHTLLQLAMGALLGLALGLGRILIGF